MHLSIIWGVLMRIAVFSDVHSNMEALTAFIDHASNKMIDRYVCLGDIVGYGANPNQCIQLVSALPGSEFILGNHDNAAMGGSSQMNCNAKKVISWTKDRLSPESILFLKKMKIIIKWKNLFFCHSNPYRPLEWTYVSGKSFINKSFARSKAKILFIGHTHTAAAITRKNIFCVYIKVPQNRSVFPAASIKRQIFNCGSIGQPRDGDPRASYLIYDTCESVIEFYRVSYDHETAANKIVAAGLPESFALRLLNGQ